MRRSVIMCLLAMSCNGTNLTHSDEEMLRMIAEANGNLENNLPNPTHSDEEMLRMIAEALGRENSEDDS